MHPFPREDAPWLKEHPKEGQPKATPKTGKNRRQDPVMVMKATDSLIRKALFQCWRMRVL
ncbi:hypothetical protein EGH10_12215 [Brevibacillus laterosporus]|nr:hypothetical protein D8Z77_12815 [Brevibacillus laterosporus]RJL08045.1 hypothetical protein DM460_18835 [Brevibacillus laterosporus]TPH11387.1 hypothetical protein EGH10_12215 [Brevibacillus laterosporus]